MKIRYDEKNYIYDNPQNICLKFYIKRIIRIIGGIYFTVINSIVKPSNMKKKRYYVSICSMFRDEDRYLSEWIEYHRIIGIDHIYLYNNFSTDNYMEVLQPYIDEGFVTVCDWNVERGQLSAFKDCVDKYSNESNWIGFIDIDEFVVPNKYDNIKSFLNKFEKYGSVVIYWLFFGSSGIVSRDNDGLVCETFTVCWEKYANIGKCFFNTEYELNTSYSQNERFHHLLWPKYRGIYFPPVNEFRKYIILGDHCIKKPNFSMQINHYLLKSFEEYITRKSKKGGGTHGVGMHDVAFFYEHESRCLRKDFHIFKYIIRLKLALKKQNEK